MELRTIMKPRIKMKLRIIMELRIIGSFYNVVILLAGYCRGISKESPKIS